MQPGFRLSSKISRYHSNFSFLLAHQLSKSLQAIKTQLSLQNHPKKSFSALLFLASSYWPAQEGKNLRRQFLVAFHCVARRLKLQANINRVALSYKQVQGENDILLEDFESAL